VQKTESVKWILGKEASEAGCAFSRGVVKINNRKAQKRLMDEGISHPKNMKDVLQKTSGEFY
jgi:hypothetical protein